MDYKFYVTGMTCAACSARVEKVVGNVAGVESVEVNLLAGTMHVQATDESCVDYIISAVKNAGYGATVQGAHSVKEKKKDKIEENLKKMN